MKNVVLASLLLLTMGNAFGVTVEKNDISIEYKKCRFYAVKIDYRTERLGLPYCITITNSSDRPIVVDASLISDPMYSLNEIAKAIRYEYKVGTILFALTTSLAGALAVTHRPTSLVPYLLLGGPLATVAAGSFTTYLLYKLIRETEKVLKTKLAKEVLHSHVTIQPGKSVKKLFWPKNSHDQLKIDFDAIKVLK